jgi:methyl-accepting chemotaxis protein
VPKFRTIRAQLLGLIGLSQILLLAAALTVFYNLEGAIADYQHLLKGPVAQSMRIEQANLELKDQVQAWKNLLLRGSDKAAAEDYWRQFEAHSDEVGEILREMFQSPLVDRDLRGEIDRLQIQHHYLNETYQKGHAAFMASGGDAKVGDSAVKGMDREVSAKMAELVEETRSRAAEHADAIRAETKRLLIAGVVSMLLAALVIAILAIVLIGRRIVNPINTVVSYIDDLSSGRIQSGLDIERSDEIGQLTAAANRLRETLTSTFEQLQQNSASLDAASGELNTIATEMGAGAQDQFSRTDQVATAMHEMSVTAQEVSRYAVSATEAADEADRSAQEGERAMQSTTNAITDMRSQIDNTAQIITRLEGDSERIGKVLEVIRGIADQTNLLALNAAIEAARAGAAGRGFAVVADEVRTLASKTAESTAEIQQIIEAVQTGAAEAVKSVGVGQAKGEESVARVAAASGVLHRVSEAIESIRDMNRQIATAAEEQTSVAEDISRNLTDITMVATTTLDRVQNTLEASRGLTRLSGALRDLTQRLTQQP